MPNSAGEYPSGLVRSPGLPWRFCRELLGHVEALERQAAPAGPLRRTSSCPELGGATAAATDTAGPGAGDGGGGKGTDTAGPGAGDGGGGKGTDMVGATLPPGQEGGGAQ